MSRARRDPLPAYPVTISDHAHERFFERYAFAGMTRHDAERALVTLVRRGPLTLASWAPADLEGAGQAVWKGYCPEVSGWVKLAVDGGGEVRTCLPTD